MPTWHNERHRRQKSLIPLFFGIPCRSHGIRNSAHCLTINVSWIGIYTKNTIEKPSKETNKLKSIKVTKRLMKDRFWWWINRLKGRVHSKTKNVNFHILGPDPPPSLEMWKAEFFFSSIHSMTHPLMPKNVFENFCF